MENPIRKSRRLFPKIFRVFTLYIFVTLAVFFGYVQVFGGLTPTTISLPTGGVNANEDTAFSDLVANLMTVKSLSVDDFSLSADLNNGQMKISVEGDVAFITETKSVYIDLDIVYNDSAIQVGAIYTNPDLYLTLAGETYKFEVLPASGDFDVQQILDLVMEYVDIDMDKVNELLAKLGIDLNDLGSLMQKLSIDTKDLDNGGYEFIISVGSAISAQIITDKDMNIESIRLRDIQLANNTIKFKAPSVSMNDVAITDLIVAPEEYTDLSGFTKYIDCTKNLISNEIIKIDANVSAFGHDFDADIYVDRTDGLKVKAETSVEGIDASVTYCDEAIYIDVENLKFVLNIDDYKLWADTVEEIVARHTTQSVAEIVNGLIEKFVKVDLTQIDLSEIDFAGEAMALVPRIFNDFAKVNNFLPQQTTETENSFAMIWGNGLNVALERAENLLTGIKVVYGDVSANLALSSSTNFVEVEGEYYDLTDLLPLASYIDRAVESKQLQGQIVASYKDYQLVADYQIDLRDGLAAKVVLNTPLKVVTIYANGTNAYIVVDGVVLEMSYQDFGLYLNDIEELLGVELPNVENGASDVALNTIKELLGKINIGDATDALIAIEYLEHSVKLSTNDNVIRVEYCYDDISADIDVNIAEGLSIEMPEATDTLADLLAKAKNLKSYIEGKVYAVQFVVDYNDNTIYGSAQADINQGIYNISLLYEDRFVSVCYQDNIVYVAFDGNKVKVEIENAQQLFDIVSAMIRANDLSLDFDIDTEKYVGVAKDKLSQFTIEDLFERLSFYLIGRLDNLKVYVNYNTHEIELTTTFEENQLKQIALTTEDVYAYFNIVPFGFGTINADEYYDLLSAQRGTLRFVVGDKEYTVDVDLDLNNKVYVNAQTTLFGEEIGVTIYNNMLYIEAGELTFGANLEEARELVEYVLDKFNLTLPEISTDFDISALATLNLEELLSQFTLNVGASRLEFVYGDIALELVEVDEVELNIPVEYEELQEVVDVAKAMLDALENKVVEFAFEVEYGSYLIAGEVKYDGSTLDVVVTYDGYQVDLRLQDNTLYVAYGNMKVKFDLTDMEEINPIEMFATIRVKLEEFGVDLSKVDEILAKIEEIKQVDIEEMLQGIELKLLGSLSALEINVLKEDKEIDINLTLENRLPKTIEIAALGELRVVLDDIAFETIIEEISSEEYYDLANMTELLGFVEDVLNAKQVIGSVETTFADQEIKLDYVVDFADGIKAKVSTRLFEENIVVYLTTDNAFIQIGEVVAKIDLSQIDEYVTKLDELFNLDLVSKFAELQNQEIDIKNLIFTALNELAEVSLEETAESLLVVNYKQNRVTLTLNNGVLSVGLVGELNAGLAISAGDVDIDIPQTEEDLFNILAKVENLLEYVDGNLYAVEFAGSYKDYDLSGSAHIDLTNKIFAVELTYQNKTISVVYTGDTAYVAFDGNKLRVSVNKVQDLLEIVLPIVEANDLTFETPDVDTQKLLRDLLGEDVLALTIEDLFTKLVIDVDGSFNALRLYASLESANNLSGRLSVDFVDDKLKALSVDALDLVAQFEFVDFALPTINADEYYDLLSAQRGTLRFVVGDKEYTVDVDLDLNNKVYVNAQTTLFGEEIGVTIYNNMLYIEAGELTFGANLEEARELVEYVLDKFNLTLPEISTDFDISALATLNLEELLSQFTLNVGASRLEFVYGDIALELVEVDEVGLNIPAEYEELQEVVDVAKAMLDALENKLLEAELEFEFNGFELDGSLKLNGDDLEIKVGLANEDFILRKHQDTLYVAYGNMKWQFALPQAGQGDTADIRDILREITSDDFAVDIDFGVLTELVEMLRDYTLEDYFEKITVDIDGSLSDLKLEVFNLGNSLAKVNIKLVNSELNFVGVDICDFVAVRAYVQNVNESTMPEFNEADFVDYSDDILESVLDSMKVRENVYALTSDIAFRYSNNAFYGDIVAMATYDETQDTMLGHFVPALQIHTTALGLNTYIYLINERVYIDVQGLQLYADLNETTINDVLDFVEEYFNMSFDFDMGSLTAFRYILPAIDRIYASWVDTLISNVSYEGIQILFDDEFWYTENARFEKTILQAFTDNYNGVLTPRKVIIGANIIDSNTTIYDDYSNYWLDNEESVTQEMNFAGYLTNLVVGQQIENLNEVFVGSDNGAITALKSTYGTSSLADYNSYSTIIEMVETLLDYANGLKYQGSISANISGDTNLQVGANINIEIGDLAPGETNPEGFKLFDDKYIKVQGAFSLKNSVEHLINIFYESNKTSALYATYTHGSFIQSNSGTIKQRIDGASKTFKAKISTTHMSDIVAMILKLADINLGEDLEENLDLPECTTDFSYVQSLLGIAGKDVSSELSQGDQIISTIEDVTRVLKNIKLTRVGNTTTLSVVVDWQDHDATISIIFKEESQVLKLRKVVVSNFVFGGNTINLEINFEDFNAANFNYNTSASHIDFSDISSFIDVAVTTLNTKNWAFKGSANVSLGGGLYTINVGYDLYACFDENDELYMYIELDVPFKASVTAQALPNPDYTVYIVGGSYERRTSILEYKNGYLTIVQNTTGIKKTALSSKTNQTRGYGHGDNWRYAKDQITANIMVIMAEALGLSETAYDIIKAAINSIDAHPTIEEALLAFSKTSSGYSLKVNAENLTGMSGVENMTLNIATSKAYNVKIDGVDQGQHKFIESISTTFKIGSILEIPITLSSVSGTSYKTTGGKVIYTNDYYRQLYAYQIKTLQFESNCSEYFAAVVKPAADPITLPRPTDYVVDNGVTHTSHTFAGWYTTANFAADTEYTENKMPLDDTTLYAKWNVDTKYYRNVTFNTNTDRYSVDSIYDIEGTSFNLQTLADYLIDNGTTYTTYTFGGWYTTSNFANGTHMMTGVVPSQDTTLYARWIVDTKYYRYVTFETNSIYSSPAVYDVEGRSFVLPTYDTYDADNGVTYEVYTFGGWYTTANFANGTEVTSGVVPSQDTTLYAKWNADVQYYRAVSFETNSTEEIDSVSQLVGTSFALPTPRQKQETEGYITTFYTFAGWFTTANFAEDTQVTAGIIPEQDTTLYAKWEVERVVRSYQINLYDNGELIDTTRAVAGEEFELDALNRVNDTTLFYTDDGCTNALTSYVMPESDLNIYIRNQYNLTYYHYVLENNTYVEREENVTLYQGDAINFLPTHTDTYIDYYSGSELSYRIYFAFGTYSNVADSVTIMPNYNYCITLAMTTTRVDYHRVTLYDNGTAVDSIIVLTGDAFSLTGLNKVNSDTRFYTDANYTTLLSSYVMPNSDLAVHVRNKYTLTIKYYNSSYVQQTTTVTHYQGENFSGDISNSMKLSSITVNSGSGTSFYRTIYTYTGFYVGSTQTDYVMANSNMTIESKYSSQKQYKVSFNVSWYKPSWWITSGTVQTAATAPADQYVNAGETLNLSGFTATIKVKYGINYTYKTDGWSTSVANSSSTGVQSVKVDKSMTLYAVWKQK